MTRIDRMTPADRAKLLAALEAAAVGPIVLLPEGCFVQTTFKVGDVVRLKSGGPPMTILRTEDVDYVVAGWYNGCEIKAQPIAPDALEKCDSPGRSAAVDEALVR